MADLRNFLSGSDLDESDDDYEQELAKYTEREIPPKLFNNYAPGLHGRDRAAAIDAKMRGDDDINAAIAASLAIIDRAKQPDETDQLAAHAIDNYFDDPEEEPQPFRMPPPSPHSPLARMDAIIATQTRHSGRLMEIRNLISGLNKNLEDFDGDVFLNTASTTDTTDNNVVQLMETVGAMQRRMDILSGQMEKLTTMIHNIANNLDHTPHKKSTTPVLAAYE
jgi:arylsulfatase A-like enzyme